MIDLILSLSPVPPSTNGPPQWARRPNKGAPRLSFYFPRLEIRGAYRRQSCRLINDHWQLIETEKELLVVYYAGHGTTACQPIVLLIVHHDGSWWYHDEPGYMIDSCLPPINGTAIVHSRIGDNFHSFSAILLYTNTMRFNFLSSSCVLFVLYFCLYFCWCCL